MQCREMNYKCARPRSNLLRAAEKDGVEKAGEDMMSKPNRWTVSLPRYLVIFAAVRQLKLCFLVALFLTMLSTRVLSETMGEPLQALSNLHHYSKLRCKESPFDL